MFDSLKKRFAIFFTVSVCLGIFVTPVFADETITGNNGDISNEAITYLKSKKFMSSYNDGQFHENIEIRRADLLRVLTNLFRIEPDSTVYNNCYEDVREASNDWYSPFICYGKSNDWLENFEANYFHPLREITKGEALMILFPAFEILSENDQYYINNYVDTAKQMHILEEFDENEVLTRGELADLLFRFIVLKDFKESIFNVTLVYDFLGSGVKNEQDAKLFCSDIFKREKNETYSECLYRKLEELEDGKLFDVIQISDGDTIYINYFGNLERVRLLGIDTPELRNSNGEEECYAYKAKDKLNELIGGGKVKLQIDETNRNRDNFDRLLRYVYSEEDLFVNEFLVNNGFAIYFDKYPTKYESILRQGHDEAKELKLGLWSCD